MIQIILIVLVNVNSIGKLLNKINNVANKNLIIFVNRLYNIMNIDNIIIIKDVSN